MISLLLAALLAAPAASGAPARGSLSALSAASRPRFAAELGRLAASIPAGATPREAAALIAAARKAAPADLQRWAADAMFESLRDPAVAADLATELLPLEGGSTAARSLIALASRVDAAQFSAAYDGLAAAAGSDAAAPVVTAAPAVAHASPLAPAPALFVNETAETPFPAFLDSLYKDKAAARKIAQDLFSDLTERPEPPFAGRAKSAAEVLAVLSRGFGDKSSVRLVGGLGTGRKTLVDHLAAGVRAGRYDLDVKFLELDLPRLARLYTQPAPAGGQAPFDVFLDAVLPALAERAVIVARGADRLLEGDAAALLQLLERHIERTGQRFVFVFESEEKLPQGHFLRKYAERVELPKLEGRSATQLLLAHKPELEKSSGVKILDAAIEELVFISKDFLHRLHPQELVDNLSRALGTRMQRTQRNDAQAAVGDLFSQLSLSAAKARRTKDVRDRNEVVRLAKALDAEQQKLLSTDAPELGAEHVKDVMAKQFPEKENLIRGNKSFKRRLLDAIPKIKERIIGQDEAVAVVSEVLETVAMGLDDEKGTMGSFLFLGPTGVGKTEIAKALAEAYSGDEKALVRLDMSEYSEKHNVSRMTGPPPGYAGYDEGGALTNQVLDSPESVVLYDEVEKAHMDTYNILLQVFDDGRLTDGKGKTVDFHRTINIMTSNLASSMIVDMMQAGASAEEIKAAVRQALIDGQMVEGRLVRFKPEFLNRLSGIVVFGPLGRPMVIKIGSLQTKTTVAKPLARHGHELMKLGDGVLEHVADKKGGFDPAMGARPMVRAIRATIKDAVRNHLKEKSEKGDEGKLKVTVSLENAGTENEKIVVTSEPKIEAAPTDDPLPDGALGAWTSGLLANDGSDVSAEALRAAYHAAVRPLPFAAAVRRPRPAPATAPAPSAPRVEPPQREAAPSREDAGREPVENFSKLIEELGLPNPGGRRR